MLDLDRAWREARARADELRATVKSASKDIGTLMKAGQRDEAETKKGARVEDSVSLYLKEISRTPLLTAEEEKTLLNIVSVFRLGLQWDKRILLNYLEIFDILKKKLNLDFSDVTFDNFKNTRLDPTAYLSLMEADGSV